MVSFFRLVQKVIVIGQQHPELPRRLFKDCPASRVTLPLYGWLPKRTSPEDLHGRLMGVIWASGLNSSCVLALSLGLGPAKRAHQMDLPLRGNDVVDCLPEIRRPDSPIHGSFSGNLWVPVDSSFLKRSLLEVSGQERDLFSSAKGPSPRRLLLANHSPRRLAETDAVGWRPTPW